MGSIPTERTKLLAKSYTYCQIGYNTIMKKVKIQFKLPVSILREGKSYVAYSPALDLSSVGQTAKEAQIHLEEAAQLFFEEIIEKGTFEEVLLELGWRRQNKQLIPPVLVSQRIQQFSVQGPAALYA